MKGSLQSLESTDFGLEIATTQMEVVLSGSWSERVCWAMCNQWEALIC